MILQVWHTTHWWPMAGQRRILLTPGLGSWLRGSPCRKAEEEGRRWKNRMGDAGAQSTGMRMGAGGTMSHLHQHLQSRRWCSPPIWFSVSGSGLVFHLAGCATPQLSTVLDTTPARAMLYLPVWKSSTIIFTFYLETQWGWTNVCQGLWDSWLPGTVQNTKPYC